MGHVEPLGAQIEAQMCRYEVKEEKVDVALALVKPEGFTREIDDAGAEVYTAEIVYLKERESLLMRMEDLQLVNTADFGFHYTPYNFDSNPEKSFCEKLVLLANADPEQVEDVYFTGALTTPDKTDFYVEYRDEHGDWRRYTPDFVIRLKNGKCLIIEIKDQRMKDDPVQGTEGRKAMAIRRWEGLNPDRLRYEMIFVGHEVAQNQMKTTREFVKTGAFPPTNTE